MNLFGEMETILNVGGLIVHGELEKARAALKGLNNGTRTVQASASCVGGTSRVPSNMSVYESRDDRGDSRDLASCYSRSIGTESTASSMFIFPGDDSVSKDSTLDDLLKSTSSDFSRASHSQSYYSDSMCTDRSNYASFAEAEAATLKITPTLKRHDGEEMMESVYRQEILERVTSEGSQSEWSVRELPDEGACTVPIQRHPSFISQSGEEVSLREPTCSEVVKDSEKKTIIKPSKGNRMSVQLERAKKGSRGSVKSPASMNGNVPNSTMITADKSRVSATNIDTTSCTTTIATPSSLNTEPTRMTTRFFHTTRPKETTPRTSRIRRVFFARNLQSQSNSVVKIGGGAPRTTSPVSAVTTALASIGQGGALGSQAGSDAGNSLAYAQMSPILSPTGISSFNNESTVPKCIFDDNSEKSKMDMRSIPIRCDERKMSMSNDNVNVDPSTVDDNNDLMSTVSRQSMSGSETIRAWIENAAVAVSPRNLLGNRWKVVETAKENSYEVILNCLDQVDNFCDNTDQERGMALELSPGEVNAVLDQLPDLCGKQGDHSESNELASIPPEKVTTKWFAVNLSKFGKSKASLMKECASDENILLAHILDEINLEKDKLKQEKDKLIKAVDGLENVSDEDIELPQGFSDLIANEIAEEICVRTGR